MGTLWTRYHTILTALLVAGFGGVALLKQLPDATTRGGPDGSTGAVGDSVQSSSSFWDRYRRATDARIRGSYGRATDLYREALRERPRHADARFYLGNVLAQSGHLAEAERTWRALLADEPASARVRGQLAGLHLCSELEDQHDPARAKAHLHAVIRQHGTETQPVVRLAQILVLQDSLDRARETLASISARDRQPAAASFLHGYLAWRSGRSREATIRRAEAGQALRAQGTGIDRTESFAVPSSRRHEACRAITGWRTLLAGADSTEASSGTSVYERFDRWLRDTPTNSFSP